MSEVTLRRRLSPMDAFFLYSEREESPMHVGGVCIFEGKMSYRKVVASLESRLDLIPRYHQRVMFPPFKIGHPTWEWDPDFDIRNHVFRTKLPAPGTDRELRELTGKIWTELLDRDKPLWDMHVVEGLSGDRSAFIVRVHHAMVDGVAGIGLLFVLMDLMPDAGPIPRKKPFRPAPLPDSASQLYDALWDNAIEGVEHWTRFQRNVADYGRGLDEVPLTDALTKFGATLGKFLLPFNRMPFNAPLNGVRKVAFHEFSFADTRAIRAVCGGTVNDVMLTILSGAVLRYLDSHPGSRPRRKNLRVLAPVNVRHETERASMGNHISFLPIEVPLDLEDDVERLHAIHLRTRELKRARIPEAVSLMFDVIQGAPAPLQALSLSAIANPAAHGVLRRVIPIPPANMICTNVPGPQVPLYNTGHRLLALYPKVPVCLEMGLNCAITSYDQKIFVSLIADAQAAYDVDIVMNHFVRAFEDLRETAAIKEAAYVRITREAQQHAEEDSHTDNGRRAAPARKRSAQPAAR